MFPRSIARAHSPGMQSGLQNQFHYTQLSDKEAIALEDSTKGE